MMSTEEMHQKLLANLMEITGKNADELVPGLHAAGVEAHKVGDPAVNEVHAKFIEEMAAELGIDVDTMESYTPRFGEREETLKGLADDSGKTTDEVHEAFSKVGGKYHDDYAKAKADNHEGFVVRMTKELNLDREIIEKAFIFD